jgi:hypothetical protein
LEIVKASKRGAAATSFFRSSSSLRRKNLKLMRRIIIKDKKSEYKEVAKLTSPECQKSQDQRP